MLSTIESVNSAVNNFIWGVPAMICIIGVGLYLSIRTDFLQIRKFPYAMKVTIGRMLRKRDASDGALTPFQAVCTALAATVGTGNIAGVAGAIAIGGPGAVFWMWISALLGMCTKFSEVTLAVHFHETNAEGDRVGGPMYYIKNGLKAHWHWLAYLFAAFGVLTVFGTGNATQALRVPTGISARHLRCNRSSCPVSCRAGLPCCGSVAVTVCLSGAAGTGPGCQRAVSCPACVPVFPVLSGQAASRPDVQAFQGWFPSTAQTVSLSAVPCSCPPSFRLPAVSGGQSAVMVQFFECPAVLPDGMGVKNPPDFREPVLAFAPQDHVSDTVIIPHALQGPLAYA